MMEESGAAGVLPPRCLDLMTHVHQEGFVFELSIQSIRNWLYPTLDAINSAPMDIQQLVDAKNLLNEGESRRRLRLEEYSRMKLTE